MSNEKYPFTKEDRELLVRLDERIKELKETVEELATLQRTTYVTKAHFAPVERAVYAFIGFFITSVIGGLVTWLSKGHP